MTHLEELIKKIQNVCPELMEMSFGCKYSVGRDAYIKTYIRSYTYPEYYCGECREGKLFGSAFVTFRCGFCRKTHSYPNTGAPKYCSPCAQKHEVCFSCKRPMKIIGHPITLEHVLLTFKYSSSLSGEDYRNELMRILKHWDMCKDLSHQSPEVIEFLYNIICKA